MLSKTFAQIDALQNIILTQGIQPTRPNIEAIEAKIKLLNQKIENYLDGMGAE